MSNDSLGPLSTTLPLGLSFSRDSNHTLLLPNPGLRGSYGLQPAIFIGVWPLVFPSGLNTLWMMNEADLKMVVTARQVTLRDVG